MGGRVDPGGANDDDLGAVDRSMGRTAMMVERLRSPPSSYALARSLGARRNPNMMAYDPPTWLERLSMPAPWEQSAASAMADIGRRAMTPAPWEQRFTSALLRLLRGG